MIDNQAHDKPVSTTNDIDSKWSIDNGIFKLVINSNMDIIYIDDIEIIFESIIKTLRNNNE